MPIPTQEARELWQAFGFRRIHPDETLVDRIRTFYEAHFNASRGGEVAMRFIVAKMNFENMCAIRLRDYGIHPDLMQAAGELDAARLAVHELHGGVVVTGPQLLGAVEFCEARAALHHKYGLFITHTGGRFFQVARAH